MDESLRNSLAPCIPRVKSASSRIEAFEAGRHIPVSSRPPILSMLFANNIILEHHFTPSAAEYGERVHSTHVLALFDVPVRAASRTAGLTFEGQVRSGDVWVVPHSVTHYSRFAGPHGAALLSLSTSFLERQVSPILSGGRIELFPQFNLKDEQLLHLLRALLAAKECSASDSLVAELLVNAICIRLAKRFAVSKIKLLPRGGLPPARLKRVSDYIDSSISSRITLSDLAEVADISLCYFATLFKQSTGRTPHQYVLHQRVQRAKEMLVGSKLSVQEIALALGFEHQNNFARTFRRIVGVSPRQFRLACS